MNCCIERENSINTEILLTDNVVHPWIRTKNIYMRGWFFYKDEYYSGERLLLFYQLYQEFGFEGALSSIRGNYAVIIDESNFMLASVDRISSFPLFYRNDGTNLIISDSVSKIWGENPDISFGEGFHSFETAGFAVGRRTVLDGVYRIQSGELIKFKKDSQTMYRRNWFMHIHKGKESMDTVDVLVKQLDIVVLNAFRRMIQSIKGKTVVIFLSGGYDSRLVAVTLKRLEYENVICLSFGFDRDTDTSVAKQIAEQLGYPWRMIKTDKAFWREKRKDGTIDQMLALSKRSLDFMSFLQAPVIVEAVKRGYIPNDCVIVTGQSGDAIEGEDVSRCFEQAGSFFEEEIIQTILRRHFFMQGKIGLEDQRLHEEIKDLIHEYVSDTVFDEALAEDVVECFNWRERQTKYVVNEVRNCDDYCHMEWRLPLWDEEFVDFWLSVPYSIRKGRWLYYQYISEEHLPTANVISSFQKRKNWFKKMFPRVASLGYWLKGLHDYFITDASYYAPLGGIRPGEYWKVFQSTRGFLNNPMMYYLYLMKEGLCINHNNWGETTE